MSKIEIKIHALSTETASKLYQFDGKFNVSLHGDITLGDGDKIPHHLYITTSETPKEEGIYIIVNDQLRKTMILHGSLGYFTIDSGHLPIHKGCRKVVATDDKDLQINVSKIHSGLLNKEVIVYNTLSPISPEFQQAWVKAANEGKLIVDAQMEMEEIDEGEEDWLGDNENGEPFWNSKIVTKPKLNSQGYVTILPVKEKTYTQQELNSKIAGALMSGLQYGYAMETNSFEDEVISVYSKLCKIWEVEKMYSRVEILNALNEPYGTGSVNRDEYKSRVIKKLDL